MAAFDTLAPSYDKDFTQTPIGQILRNRVHARLLSHFKLGDKVLEMGCGTGEDALFLADKGINITATDASPKMLAITKQKTQHLQNIAISQLDLANLTALNDEKYKGAFSNFGALNCLNDWKALAAWLAERIEMGGILGLGIMSPYCFWEFAWHALHWKWDIALRRLRGSEFEGITITYPTIERISQDFSPYFRPIHIMPLGLFLPTSALFDVVQKRPHLLKTLTSLENHFGNISQLSLLADHYWIELERI